MVGRVYGRPPLEDLRTRLAQALGTDCRAGATARAESGDFGRTRWTWWIWQAADHP